MSGQSWHEITISRESRHTTTAKPPKADINHTGWNVRLVPTPDIRNVRITGAMWHFAMPVEEPSTVSRAVMLRAPSNAAICPEGCAFPKAL